jgi:hypothetical protein
MDNKTSYVEFAVAVKTYHAINPQDALTCAVSEWVVPVQVSGVEWDYEHILGHVGLLDDGMPMGVGVYTTRKSVLLKHERLEGLEYDDRSFYPLKEHVSATTKVNIFFKDVLVDARRFFPNAYNVWSTVLDRTYGMMNDEASGWLIWLTTAMEVFDHALCVRVLINWDKHSVLKNLSNTVKALGLAGTRAGSHLVELGVLRGRSVDVPRPEDDVTARIDKTIFDNTKAAHVDISDLRRAIRRIIKSELKGKPSWASPETFWKRRWLTTKAGAHSQFYENAVFGHRLDLPERPTRREFAENCQINQVAYGEPRTDAGLSWKLEHGKTRAIYSCDTRSYYTFDYLLAPVEEAWLNFEILLNPGAKTELELFEDFSKRGPCYLMLDYDDFNSQHTIESMVAVIEEVCADAPPDILKWAVESIKNTVIHWIASDSSLNTAEMVGGLPSGHRATTFINTILNAAYVDVANGGRPSAPILHTGDDIIMAADAFTCESVLRNMLKSQFRTNATKQGIGPQGEFLRVSFNSKEARGYVARSVASLVSGNWVSEASGSASAIAENIISAAWNISLRGGCKTIGLLCNGTLLRRVPVLGSLTIDLLRFKISLNCSPVLCEDWVPVKVVTLKDSVRGSSRERASGRHAYATQDFLTTFIDFEKVKLYGVKIGSLAKLMQDVSYKPTCPTESKPVMATSITSSPIVTHARHYKPAKRLSSAIERLRNWARTPEEFACFRLLSAAAHERTSTSAVVLTSGNLPWGLLRSIGSTASTPRFIYTSYRLRK